MVSDDTEENVNDDEVANDDAAGGGAEGGVDRVADAEEHDDDVDGDGDLDIDDEASDDDSPVEELINPSRGIVEPLLVFIHGHVPRSRCIFMTCLYEENCWH